MTEKNPISSFVHGPVPPGTSALYRLSFPNGKAYIGISTNPSKRLRLHKKYAADGSKFAVHKAIRRFGFQNVRQEILLIGATPFILEMEACAIAEMRMRDATIGYNMAAGGGANPMDDPDVRQKVRLAQIGRKETPEVCAKKKASWTPERRAAMSALHKGKVISKAHREACSIAGRSRTAEERKRQGDSLRGKKQSPEFVAKRTRPLIGRKNTPEQHERQLAAMRTPEYREKMRQVALRRWGKNG